MNVRLLSSERFLRRKTNRLVGVARVMIDDLTCDVGVSEDGQDQIYSHLWIRRMFIHFL